MNKQTHLTRRMFALLLVLCLSLTLFTIPAMAASYKEVVSCRYDDAFDFSEGLATVELNGKYGYIDKTGKEVIAIKYDDA